MVHYLSYSNCYIPVPSMVHYLSYSNCYIPVPYQWFITSYSNCYISVPSQWFLTSHLSKVPYLYHLNCSWPLLYQWWYTCTLSVVLYPLLLMVPYLYSLNGSHLSVNFSMPLLWVFQHLSSINASIQLWMVLPFLYEWFHTYPLWMVPFLYTVYGSMPVPYRWFLIRLINGATPDTKPNSGSHIKCVSFFYQ